MCSPDAIISDMYAFLPLSPTKEKTGSISAVGIDPNFRGKGVGLGLVARAMENMKERGIEGIMVDSTWLRGFYEKLGFKAQWEYERWAWEDAKQ
jgi:beta-N-acetylhexosaminidase